jgi:hypothetical protein
MFSSKELPLGCAVGLGKNEVRFSTDSSSILYIFLQKATVWSQPGINKYTVKPTISLFLGLQMENVHGT